MVEVVTDQYTRTITFEDFAKICRFCLAEGELGNIFNVMYHELNMAELYQYLFSSEIYVNDDLPQNMCEKCIYELVRMYNFRTTTLRNEAALRAIVQANEESSGMMYATLEPIDCDVDIKEDEGGTEGEWEDGGAVDSDPMEEPAEHESSEEIEAVQAKSDLESDQEVGLQSDPIVLKHDDLPAESEEHLVSSHGQKKQTLVLETHASVVTLERDPLNADASHHVNFSNNFSEDNTVKTVMYICSCESSFERLIDLDDHREKCATVKKCSKKISLNCDHCSRKFTTKQALRKHMKADHKGTKRS